VAKKKETKLEQQLQPVIGEILNGYLLSIDPSSGSKDSQPGYCIFKAGQYVDSGFLNIGSGDDIGARLYRLARCLREEFEQPDVLITENIPPFMSMGGNNSFATSGVIHLHQSIGVVLSVFDCPKIRVSPRSWHSMLDKLGGNYIKSDENDACAIAMTAVATARQLNGMIEATWPEQLRKKLSTDQWQ